MRKGALGVVKAGGHAAALQCRDGGAAGTHGRWLAVAPGSRGAARHTAVQCSVARTCCVSAARSRSSGASHSSCARARGSLLAASGSSCRCVQQWAPR